MEHILSCDNYNGTTLTPRVLNYGHSVCTPCIKKLDNLICPGCGGSSFAFLEDFPINYSLLNLSGECKTSESLKLDVLPHTQNLREKLNIMLLDIEKEISEKIKIKNNIENNLEILQSLEHNYLQEVCAINKSRERLNNMKRKCEQLSQSLSAASLLKNNNPKASYFLHEYSQTYDSEQLSQSLSATSLSKNDDTKAYFSHEYSQTDDSEQLSQSFSAASLSKNDDPKAFYFSHKYIQTDDSLNVAEETSINQRRYEQLSSSASATCLSNTNEKSPDFSLINSQTNYPFLEEIYNALKNSEKIFAYKCIHSKFKFGQLVIVDNELLIYSLTLNEAPNGSKIVSFEDLKEFTKAKNLLTFIELKEICDASSKIFFKLNNNSRCSNFIKLCTGECGPSYKNCVYSGVEHSSENHLLQPILNTDVLYQLSCENFNNSDQMEVTDCYYDDVLLIGKPKEGFQLCRQIFRKKLRFKIMGKVIKPTNLNHVLTNSKIWDCGIAFEL